jgi:hypothetical protein
MTRRGASRRHDDAVLEGENLQLPIRCRRDGGEPVALSDDSDGSDLEALLDQGGG